MWSNISTTFMRATADLAENIGGVLPSLELGLSAEPSAESPTAIEKYGPGAAVRKWRKGGARVSAHLSFEFLHAKFNPDAVKKGSSEKREKETRSFSALASEEDMVSVFDSKNIGQSFGLAGLGFPAAGARLPSRTATAHSASSEREIEETLDRYILRVSGDLDEVQGPEIEEIAFGSSTLAIQQRSSDGEDEEEGESAEC